GERDALLAGLLGAESNRGDLGVGEHHARDRVVADACGPPEDVLRGDPSLVLGHMCERHRPGHVPDRPHAVPRAAALVDLDSSLAGFDPGVLETAREAGAAPRGDEQLLAAHHLAVRERQLALAIRALHRLGLDIQSELDAILAQRRLEQLAGCALLAFYEVRSALDDGHLDPEPAQELAELGAHRAAAENHHALRQLSELGRFTVRPIAAVVESLERWNRRIAAGSDHDALGGERLLPHLHTARSRDPRLVLVDIDPLGAIAVDML